ncbi:enoyl-CoA hydratase/isomerase [Nitzschia inconspicua]|uniref:Enoyl-CoA delta isomerase 1, mitochondrial n=1 Tax=Nitzschia inconspicua TaxID=303405 RepID=A0A9K3PRN7_9STRA|nr:enoyl-CoA hydratase/isomerase [Nitzschia inconspicua]
MSVHVSQSAHKIQLWRRLGSVQYRDSSLLQRQHLSSFSSKADRNDDLVTLEASPDTGVATLRMHRSPANSLSMEMMQSISGAIRKAESDRKIQSLILTSSLPSGIFSAGLELTELYQPDLARLPKFWESFQQLYLDLYGSRLSTIASIGGPAPAAGCMLSLSCDYRIMTDNPKCTIGLNESQLGIVAPPWLAQQYIDVIGNRNAELALLLGTLFTPQQALTVGLVDELVCSGDSSIDEMAQRKAAEFIRIPPKARVAAKELTRGTQIAKLSGNREEDTEFFCSFVTTDTVQKTLGSYLEMLAKRKK